MDKLDLPEERFKAPATLQTTAPGLLRNCRHYFNSSELDRLNQAYALADTLGLCKESPVLRDPEASFNPRPARICQLILSETKTCTLELACLALLSRAAPADIPEIEESFPEIIPDLQLLQKFFESGKSQPLSPNLCNVSLAILLDDARHLHMTALTLEERKQSFQRLKALVDDNRLAAGHERLQLLLKTWLINSEKRYQN